MIKDMLSNVNRNKQTDYKELALKAGKQSLVNSLLGDKQPVNATNIPQVQTTEGFGRSV